MQYLVLEGNETLVSLSRTLGQNNVDEILAESGIPRVPNVAKEWNNKCDTIISEYTKDINPSRKMALLNGLTNSEDVFEKACLMDEDEWKVFSATQSFTDALKVPQSVSLPYSSKIMGNASDSIVYNTTNNGLTKTTLSPVNPVSSVTYKAVMNSLETTGNISPAIFNTVNTGPDVSVSESTRLNVTSTPLAFGNLPWGKVQMYSTILQQLIDFPAYPEELETSRQANYATMPDIIYQYEPWITFQDSGPREQSLSFHLHRDMWTGDHRDGNANKLIRFCEANTFADYNGSAVITPLIRFYIDGVLFISGVLKNVNVTWSGPLGLDNWYLEFTLSMAIQEISESELNIRSVYKKKLKEG